MGWGWGVLCLSGDPVGSRPREKGGGARRRKKGERRRRKNRRGKKRREEAEGREKRKGRRKKRREEERTGRETGGQKETGRERNTRGPERRLSPRPVATLRCNCTNSVATHAATVKVATQVTKHGSSRDLSRGLMRAPHPGLQQTSQPPSGLSWCVRRTAMTSAVERLLCREHGTLFHSFQPLLKEMTLWQLPHCHPAATVVIGPCSPGSLRGRWMGCTAGRALWRL